MHLTYRIQISGRVCLKSLKNGIKIENNKKLDDTPDAKSAKFDLDIFITQKLGKMISKNEKKTISDARKSSLADLVKFNTTLAHSFYKINDEAILETSLLFLQPEEDIQKLDLSPSVI